MTAFRVRFEIGDSAGARWRELEGLVDTGSTYTWLPRSVLEDLGITPESMGEFETADGRIVMRDMAEARVRLNGRTRTTLVVFANEGDSNLLGVYTLEGLSLGVDPVNEGLIPVRGLAMVRRALP